MSNEAKFSSGSWTVFDVVLEGGQRKIGVICQSDEHTDSDGDGADICAMSNLLCLPESQVKANANLIAAAPDLYTTLLAIVAAELESIDELVKEYGFDPEDRPSWLVRLRAAEAALAKAKGEIINAI